MCEFIRTTEASPSAEGVPLAIIDAMQREELRAREGRKTTPHATGSEPESLSKARRCFARRKTGEPCRGKAMRDRKTCRMHSGGKGSGPKGAANPAYRHGNATQEAIAQRKQARALLEAVANNKELGVDLGTDWTLMAALLAQLGIKETRAMKSARNKAAWSARDRRQWGGEDRRGWPKRPGRNGYGG